MKIDTANNIDWIKPLAFQKYIDERHESMVDEIELFEKQQELVATPTTPNICNTPQAPISK
jgi:hypothetical protein